MLRMECLLLFKYCMQKCHLHPQSLPSPLSPSFYTKTRGVGRGREREKKKQIEGFLYIFKLELSYVIIFRVKCICQITDFEFVLGIHKTIKNFNPTGNVWRHGSVTNSA